MKHILIRLVSLLLILCLLVPTAVAETAGESLPGGISIRYLFVRNGSAHALTYEGLMYRLTDGGWQELGNAYEDVWAVDANGSDVCFLTRGENANGAWYALRQAQFDEQGRFTGTGDALEITWDVDGDSWPQFDGLVVAGDIAYALVTARGTETSLYRIDMVSGKGTAILGEPLHTLARYRDGLLLAQRLDWESYDDKPQVVTVDPATGATEVLATMTSRQDGGLAYDAEHDAVYFSGDSYVYRVEGDAPQAVSYLPPSNMSGGSRPAVMLDGHYCFADYNGFTSASIDPSLLPRRTLKVSSAAIPDGDLVYEFAKAHPDIAVVYADHSYGGLENFTRFMQDENAPDVFQLLLSENYITLRDRKYLADLSSSDILMSTVQRMAENVTRDILVDGALYALPYGLQMSLYGYYPRALEKAGLTAEDVPSSYEGLLDFIERWHEDYFEENEGMQLFEYYEDLRGWLFQEMLSTQLRACQKDGALTIDTPAFRKLIARLEELTPVINEVAPPLRDEDSDGWGNALFTDMVDTVVRNYPFDELYGARPMPLALDEASDPTINATLNLLVLNPYSQNADIAVEFMEYVAEHLPASTKTALMPDENDPIERLNYEQGLQKARDRVALLEKQVEEAPEADRVDLQDELDYSRRELQSLEENRWAMTAEEVRAYRERFAPYLTFTTVSVYTENTNEQLHSLIHRYLDGQASADEFISRFEEIVWMRQEERH